MFKTNKTIISDFNKFFELKYKNFFFSYLEKICKIGLPCLEYKLGI